MSGFKCSICRRSFITSDKALIEHLAGHSPAVLAEELFRFQQMVKTLQRRQGEASTYCGKVAYKSEDAALAALVEALETGGSARREVRAYQCNHCRNRWHLTSQRVPDGVSV